HRRAKMSILGDSIQNNFPGGMQDCIAGTVWKPDLISGIAGSAGDFWGSLIAAAAGTITSVMTTAPRHWSDGAEPGSIECWSLWYSRFSTFTGSAVPAKSQPSSNEAYYWQISTGSVWSDGGAWLNSSLTCTAVMLAHSSGVQSVTLHGRDAANTTEY